MPRDIDELAADQAHVWFFDLDRSANDEHLLSQDEQQRADRFIKSEDQRRFRAARAFVRQSLARYLNVPPLSLVFGTTTTGKPFVQGLGQAHSVAFNLAHSAQFGLLAVTRGREIGVDIEIERNLEDLEGMARQIMSPSEFQRFQSTEADRAREAFFGLWTQKEALVKAAGTGFSTDPREINLGLLIPSGLVTFRGMTWSVASLEAQLPLRAAIAVSGELPAVLIFRSNFASDPDNSSIS